VTRALKADHSATKRWLLKIGSTGIDDHARADALTGTAEHPQDGIERAPYRRLRSSHRIAYRADG
jgi:hypothetical protein